MTVQIRGGDVLNYRGEALLLFHPSDVKPLSGSLALLDWRFNAAVSLLWKRKADLFRFGQLTVMASQGKLPCDTVLLTGLGSQEDLSPDLRREAYRVALDAVARLGCTKVAVEGIPLDGSHDKGVLEDLNKAIRSLAGGDRLGVSLFSADKEFARSLREGRRLAASSA